jgi:hypothetical protein
VLRTAPAGRSLPIPCALLPQLSDAPDTPTSGLGRAPKAPPSPTKAHRPARPSPTFPALPPLHFAPLCCGFRRCLRPPLRSAALRSRSFRSFQRRASLYLPHRYSRHRQPQPAAHQPKSHPAHQAAAPPIPQLLPSRQPTAPAPAASKRRPPLRHHPNATRVQRFLSSPAAPIREAHHTSHHAARPTLRPHLPAPGSASAPPEPAAPVPAVASIPYAPSATRRYVHSSLHCVALLLYYACCAPVASVIPAPSRPSTHRPNTIAATAPNDAPLAQAYRTAPVPHGARKRPRAARPLPPQRQQATGKKARRLPGKVCVQATQAAIRPASRSVSLGSTPNPRIHAQASARSSSSGSAASRWSALHPHKVPFGLAYWGPQGRPPNPLAKGI